MGDCNILAVDDEAYNLKALERVFRREECGLYLANSGEKALSLIEQNEIYIVISDLRMPGMTGIELLKKIANDRPDTVRLILTGYAEAYEEIIKEACSAGYINGYMTKPWEPEEIKAFVRESMKSFEASHLSIIGKRIGELLVDNGVISLAQLDAALDLQKNEALNERRKLGEILISMGYTNEDEIFYHYAMQLGIPFVSVTQFSINPGLIDILPPKLARRYGVVPLDIIGKILTLATSEPLIEKAKTEIEKAIGYKVMLVLASPSDIQVILDQNYPEQSACLWKLSDINKLQKVTT
jgi:CheY-like chemotaxis protein